MPRQENQCLSVADESSQFVAFPSELGWMAIEVRRGRLCRLTFGQSSAATALKALDCRLAKRAPLPPAVTALVKRLQAYAAGKRDDFRDVRADLDGLSPFRQRVLECCRRIPFGATLSYAELAAKAGFPGAARAVGNCMAGNRIPLVIPCHRVVRSDGGLGKYSAPGGSQTKRRLIRRESAN